MAACAPNKQSHTLTDAQQIVDSIKIKYAPDHRTSVYNIGADLADGKLILNGETNVPEAKEKLLEQLQVNGFLIEDRVNILPGMEMASRKGIVTISVANMRVTPSHSAELSTQLLMGMPVDILKEENYWYLVQGPDSYIGWVDKPAIQALTELELGTWESTAKIIFTDIYGFLYDNKSPGSEHVSDLVAGNILQLIEETDQHFKIALPDGRTGYVGRESCMYLNDWLATAKPDEGSLVEFAKSLMGVPYLWGGTSVKGMDCSGFTKTVYFMNGRMLPRDASQQVEIGTLVDDGRDFSKLEIGDLLFFGSRDDATGKERIVHVGMWLGNNEFIHASGKVMIGSMDPKAKNFDQYNFNRYLRAKRVASEHGIEIGYFK